MKNSFELYGEFPAHITTPRSFIMDYFELAQEMDDYGFSGSLVYYFHQCFDPWITATALIQNTKNHIPLIAVQPYSIPPFIAAKMIQTFTHLYQRKLYINIVTGQAPKDLMEIEDPLDKSQRYNRLIEFTTIVQPLLKSNEPFSFEGDYYKYSDLHVKAAVQNEFMPKIFIATGTTSVDGMRAARQVGDVTLTIPKNLSDFQSYFPAETNTFNRELGIKINLICKPSTDEALNAANSSNNFRIRELWKKKNKNEMQMQYSKIEEKILFPTTGYPGDPPMIVGSYEEVSIYLEEFMKIGVRHFIIGNIYNKQDIHDVYKVFEMLK